MFTWDGGNWNPEIVDYASPGIRPAKFTVSALRISNDQQKPEPAYTGRRATIKTYSKAVMDVPRTPAANRNVNKAPAINC